MFDRLGVVFVCFWGICSCLPSQEQVADHLIHEVNDYLKKTYQAPTVLRDSFRYRFNQYLKYSSNYSLGDISSASRAKRSRSIVTTVRCGRNTRRFMINLELEVGAFQLSYLSQWKFFQLSYDGNMTVFNNDLKARVRAEVFVDLAKSYNYACKTTVKSLSVSKWGLFQVTSSSKDKVKYRPLEKMLSFVLTAHIPKVLDEIMSTFTNKYPVPEELTERMCPYFRFLASKNW